MNRTIEDNKINPEMQIRTVLAWSMRSFVRNAREHQDLNRSWRFSAVPDCCHERARWMRVRTTKVELNDDRERCD